MRKLTDPLVSVVITTYNRESLLKEAIRSVEQQTYKNIELIVVDDTSEKKHQDFFSEFNSKITYIHKDSNKGATKSRNIGMKKSKGKYIAFLDDDDLILPEKIEKQVRILENESFNHVNICITWILDKRFGVERINKTPEVIDHEYILQSFNLQSTSAYLYRKKALLDINGFDENLVSAHEYDTALRLSREAVVISISEPLTIQRQTEGQISENWRRKITGMLQLYSKYHKEYGIGEYIKFLGIISLYVSAYVVGNRIHKIIIPMKDRGR